jgi:predicted nucleic acid-binding protein
MPRILLCIRRIVTLIDANLYAANRQAVEHERTMDWLEGQLNGKQRVGMPWESLTAFVRLATNPRVTDTDTQFL